MNDIPFIDLKTQYERLRVMIGDNIQEVLDGGQYVLGPAVSKFEAEMASYLSCKHAISVSSGTDALFMPLLGMELTEKDAVFVPSFTYTSTAEAILLAKATPVFVEVDADTFLIDLDDLNAKIDEAKAGGLTPRVILPVDLFGQPADYPAINAIAAKHGMVVLADAAQAFGAMLGNRYVGTLTDITATSFYPSKPLGCYGDGGAIFLSDDALADQMKSIRAHGKGNHKYDVVRVGLNGRLDSLQAAILSAKLTVFEEEIAARERVAQIYDAELKGVVAVPKRVPNSRCAWAQYTIKTDDRERLQATAKAAGVPTMVFYPRPMHLQPAYVAYGKGEGSLVVSERVSEQVLSLPMNPYLDDAAVQRVCDAIKSHF